jgi:AraC family transcriptional regulator
MNHLAQMNQAMDYLEKHLTKEINFERMAQIAGCTEYHFRRMFSYLAGIPIGEYIRCRKLALAGTLLREGQKVIDCAVLLGYDSPDAFRRAFQELHGISLSDAKRGNTILKAFPPMTFQLTIKGGTKMDYRIVHKGEFSIVGFKKRITLQFEGINSQIDNITAKLTPEIITELKGLCDIEPEGILNASVNFEDQTLEGTELDQYVCVATTKPAPDGYDVLRVEESYWAVFTVIGAFPKAVQDTWARIYAEWLTSSDFLLTDAPSLLWFENTDLTKPDCKNEIWIPVAKRQ